MRFDLHALFKPADPVVAVHPSSRDADASLAVLQRAGFDRGDVSVVGQGGSRIDLTTLPTRRRADAPHWAASGTSLGLLWAAFTVASVVLLPSGGVAFAVLVTLGTFTLLLQAAVMRHVVAHAPVGAAGVSSPPLAGHASPAWRFLVVVHGSRSDIALARALLSAS